MGKFRAKPTRSVAKSFRHAATAATKLHDKESMEIDSNLEAAAFQNKIKFSDDSKISKKKKSRSSALKKKVASLSVSSSSTSPKKSVTFQLQKETVQDILKKKALDFVKMVTQKEGILSKLKKPELMDKVSNTSSLNKVFKNTFKDKKSRRISRKEAFQKKLSLIKASEEEVKAQKRRKETVIVGDLQPMAQILEELKIEQELKDAQPAPKRPAPNIRKCSNKKRQKEMLDALKFFESAGF